MKIILVRHGKPLINQTKWISSHQMADWIEEYNQAKIDPLLPPNANVIQLIKQTPYRICSPLKRSQDSLNMIGIEQADEIDTLFQESALPYKKIPFLKLPAALWALLFRISWFVGFSQNAESKLEARIRARNATNKLIELAKQNQQVSVIGHGIMNQLIANELADSRWVCSIKQGNGYWHYCVFEKTGPSSI